MRLNLIQMWRLWSLSVVDDPAYEAEIHRETGQWVSLSRARLGPEEES